ncbi:MAG: ABC transporter substrate-binding protein [Octadecabacter sp.]
MKLSAKTTMAAATALFLGMGAATAQDIPSIAISTIVEVPALNDTRDGVLAALAERGFVDGETLDVDYQNANGNMPTQQQIARKFVGDAPDVIIAITTPTAQSIIAATSEIPVVFASVTDPLKAQLITQFEQPGGNVTGVSDAAPIGEQLDLFLELVPDMKTIGFIYNPGLDNAVSALELLTAEATERGIAVVESPSPTTNEVIPAARSLVGNVDAIYVPNDTTVVAALEAVVKVGRDTGTPVFAGETGAVERGVVASIGLDYLGVGHAAGMMVADILEGANPGEIDAVLAYDVLDEFKLILNLDAAEAMGVTIPQSVMDRATSIIE